MHEAEDANKLQLGMMAMQKLTSNKVKLISALLFVLVFLIKNQKQLLFKHVSDFYEQARVSCWLRLFQKSQSM